MNFKKLFVIMASIAIIAAFAVPAFAGSFGEDYGVIPWTPEAPVVDGQMDELYENGLYYNMNHLEPGRIDTGLTTECWVVWNGDYLYAYYIVHDNDVLMPDKGRVLNPWKYDSATFMIDYTGESYYIDDNGTLAQVLQFRMDVSGYQTAYGYDPTIKEQNKMSWQAYGSGAGDVGSSNNNVNELYATDFFEAACISSSEGYTVEFKLPLSNKGFNSWGNVTLEPGDTFAICGQINDDYTGRPDELSMYRVDGVDDSIWEAQYWPNVTLGEMYEVVDEPEDPVDDPADEPVDDPADDPVDEPTDDPADEPVDDPADDPVDVPDLPGLDPVDPSDNPTDDPADDPADEPVDDPADEPVDDPADEPVDDPADDPADDPVDDPADEPVDEPADEPTDDPADDPVDDPADEPVDDPADDPADDPVDEPADEPSEPADSDITEEPSKLGTSVIGILVAVAAVIAVVVILVSKKKK